jgi:hypothetical protein
MSQVKVVHYNDTYFVPLTNFLYDKLFVRKLIKFGLRERKGREVKEGKGVREAWEGRETREVWEPPGTVAERSE